jgi:hypothetical protein
VANLFAISSFGFFGSTFRGSKWTRKIYVRPSISGKVISIVLSNLPGRVKAGSNESDMFVAANTITWSSVPKPSNSTSN